MHVQSTGHGHQSFICRSQVSDTSMIEIETLPMIDACCSSPIFHKGPVTPFEQTPCRKEEVAVVVVVVVVVMLDGSENGGCETGKASECLRQASWRCTTMECPASLQNRPLAMKLTKANLLPCCSTDYEDMVGHIPLYASRYRDITQYIC